MSALLSTAKDANPPSQSLQSKFFFTPGPWRLTFRGSRALLLGRDPAGPWEVANINMCMGAQSDGNLAMLLRAPETLQALFALLAANENGFPIPWNRAKSVAHSAVTLQQSAGV
jgi:hypothetical protein